jgi:hypothetical protein
MKIERKDGRLSDGRTGLRYSQNLPDVMPVFLPLPDVSQIDSVSSAG